MHDNQHQSLIYPTGCTIEGIHLHHFKLVTVARHHVFEAKTNGSYAKK